MLNNHFRRFIAFTCLVPFGEGVHGQRTVNLFADRRLSKVRVASPACHPLRSRRTSRAVTLYSARRKKMTSTRFDSTRRRQARPKGGGMTTACTWPRVLETVRNRCPCGKMTRQVRRLEGDAARTATGDGGARRCLLTPPSLSKSYFR